jgi:hypothetical protein
MKINDPNTVAEVEAAFARCEKALVGNDVDTLNALFWRNPPTIRYGVGEVLHGRDEIAAFRAARSRPDNDDFATTSTLCHRETASGKVGRQMQSWARLAEGWRIVAAHVSVIDEP